MLSNCFWRAGPSLPRTRLPPGHLMTQLTLSVLSKFFFHPWLWAASRGHLRSFHPEILSSFHRRIPLTPGTFSLSSDVIQKIIGGCYILNKLWTTKRGIKGRRIEEKRGRLAGEHGKAFSLITVGLKEGRYKTSLGPHCKQPVCLDKKFRIYPKCHDFQQESTSTVTATKRHWSPGVKTILRGQRLKGRDRKITYTRTGPSPLCS